MEKLFICHKCKSEFSIEEWNEELLKGYFLTLD